MQTPTLRRKDNRLLKGALANVLIGAFLTIMAGNTQAALAPKMALVIGNGAYRNGDRLQTPAADAQLIAGSLQRLGFLVRVLTDRSRAQMLQDVDGFSADASGARVALVYYAGHGFESDQKNFLMPVDLPAKLTTLSEVQLRGAAIPLEYVMTTVERAHPQAMVVMVDACRDEPGRGVTAARGLAAVNAPRGTLVAFSTSPGGKALDTMPNVGKPINHSPFSYYLSENLVAPGATLIDALQKTQVAVAAATGEGQRPWFVSGLVGQLVLAETPAAAPQPNPQLFAQAATTRGAATAGANASRSLWDSEEQSVSNAAATLDVSSFASLQRRAAAGDAQALTTLGLAYEEGHYVRANPARAMQYYQRAANQGYPIAATLLGEQYLGGNAATPVDRARAERWLRSAADAGHQRAQLDLFQLQAQRGDPDAARDLAKSMAKMFMPH
ncbi:hypothetical protein F3J17_10870 [Burkholderia sp. Ax-1719]|nr:hypothetical protein [Burkholderia sp. Ax-1719]